MTPVQYMISTLKMSAREYGPINCAPIQQGITSTYPLFDGPDNDTLSLGATGDFGSLLFHELKQKEFSIRQNNFRPQQQLHLHTTINAPSLAFHYTLKKDIHYEISGFPEACIRKNEYNLVYVPKVDWEYNFENAEYACFGIHFTPQYLKECGESFPELANPIAQFLTNVDHKTPAQFRPSHLSASGEMNVVIQNILNCSFSGITKTNYLKLKVSELLFLSLRQILEEGRKPELSMAEDDIQKLLHLRELFTTKPGVQHTLLDLVKISGLNEFKLKTGFNKLFKASPIEFMRGIYLDHSRSLLLGSNMSIQEIADAVGYTNLSNFSAAFKKRFGCAPSKINRKPERKL